VKFRLPDRNDALVLLGATAIVAGVWQVLPWLAMVIAGLMVAYVGVVTERAEPKE
jgi:fatty acid desaturase